LEEQAAMFTRRADQYREEDPDRAVQIEVMTAALSKRSDLQTYEDAMHALDEQRELLGTAKSASVLRTHEDVAFALAVLTRERQVSDAAAVRVTTQKLFNEARDDLFDPSAQERATRFLLSADANDYRYLRRELLAARDDEDPSEAARMCAIAKTAPSPAALRADLVSLAFSDPAAYQVRLGEVSALAIEIEHAGRQRYEVELANLRVQLALGTQAPSELRAQNLAAALIESARIEGSHPPANMTGALRTRGQGTAQRTTSDAPTTS
jgi:hypothetical protein